MSDELEALGNRLKEARKSAGNPTLESVAGRLHVSKSYMSQLERGKKQPSWRHLVIMAREYATTVDRLLGVDSGAAGAMQRDAAGRFAMLPEVRTLLDSFDNLSGDGRELLGRIGALLVNHELRRSSAVFAEQILRAMVSDQEWELIEGARALARAGDEVAARGIIDDWLSGRAET